MYKVVEKKLLTLPKKMSIITCLHVFSSVLFMSYNNTSSRF